MQNEISLYEMPADRMVFTHEGLAEGRDLGDAEIVNTVWGTAKVRVVNKQDKSGWAWLLATAVVLGAATMAWLLLSGTETGSPEPRQLASPTAAVPAAPTHDAPVQNLSDVHPAPVPVTAAEPAKPTQPDAEMRAKHELPRGTHAPARHANPENPDMIPPNPADAAPPGKQGMRGKQGVQEMQPDAGKAAVQPVPANPAPATETEPPNAQSPKENPPVNAQPSGTPIPDTKD